MQGRTVPALHVRARTQRMQRAQTVAMRGGGHQELRPCRCVVLVTRELSECGAREWVSW